MRLFLTFLIALLFIPGPAAAASEPIIAAAPEWVEHPPIPAANPAWRDRPVQMLLLSSQSQFGAEHIDHFAEMAVLIQNVQGLQGLGNIILPWRPEQSDLIVHKVEIIRGSTTIDLLAGGRRFTVLRRENGLESATLDGVLTAVMQADGLAIGDVLHLSFSVRQRPGLLPLLAENTFVLAHGNPIGRYFVRQIWPTSMPMRWLGLGQLDQAQVRRTRHGSELVVDLSGVEGPEAPRGAPPRFALTSALQLAGHRNWAEVSALLAPHYERAQELAPTSPLRAEIDRIAAAHPDPRSRTLAALQLVQDSVRYFAVLMGDGNYLPATADETWTRRYGDCKGKSIMLLALLRGLGIEAEPVLVNSLMGDGLDARLPQLSLFNHVVLRARIDGRSYWLDGTRTGDRVLEDLASSTLSWGLPLRAAGAELEALPYVQPRLPLYSYNVTFDGSDGFDGPIPFTAETILRGDGATLMRMSISETGRENYLRQLRQSTDDLPGTGAEITNTDLRDDADGQTLRVIVSGRTRMNWSRNTGTASQRFRFDNDTIKWNVDFERPEGPYRDAPFAFPLPGFIESTETIILPNQGQGFSFQGESFDRTVAGVRISRDLRLTNGRAIAHSRFQRLEREISARQARDSVEAIRQINDDSASLIAPVGMPTQTAADEASARPAAGSATTLIDSGLAKMRSGEMRQALADFDRALELAPDWARAHGNRGLVLIHLGRLAEAETALAQAMQRDQTDFVVHQGYGFLHQQRDRPQEAIRSYTRSLELDPNNVFNLGQRALAHYQLGEMDEALADYDRLVEVAPGHADGISRRAVLLAFLDRENEALASIDAAIGADQANFMLHYLRGEMLWHFGRREEASAAFGRALSLFDASLSVAGIDLESQLMPMRLRLLVLTGRQGEARELIDARLRQYPGNFRVLTARCTMRAEADVELQLALRDCNEALEYDSEYDEAMAARGLLYLRLERWNDAIRDFSSLLALDSRNAYGLYGRGLALHHSGNSEGSIRDIAAADRLSPTIGWEYERLGLRLETAASASRD